MKDKRYLAVSGLCGRDKLYLVTKTVERKFSILFGDFDDEWKEHEAAVDWLMLNAKYLGICTCVTP